MYPFLGIFGCYVLMLRAYGLPSYSSDMWHVLVGARGMYGSGGTGSCRGGEGHCPLLFVVFSSLLYDERLSFAEG